MRIAQWIGKDDGGFFTTALLVVFLASVSAYGINQMGHQMKNVTFKAPPAVQTASALPR